jgi:hypothetical protein
MEPNSLGLLRMNSFISRLTFSSTVNTKKA